MVAHTEWFVPLLAFRCRFCFISVTLSPLPWDVRSRHRASGEEKARTPRISANRGARSRPSALHLERSHFLGGDPFASTWPAPYRRPVLLRLAAFSATVGRGACGAYLSSFSSLPLVIGRVPTAFARYVAAAQGRLVARRVRRCFSPFWFNRRRPRQAAGLRVTSGLLNISFTYRLDLVPILRGSVCADETLFALRAACKVPCSVRCHLFAPLPPGRCHLCPHDALVDKGA